MTHETRLPPDYLLELSRREQSAKDELALLPSIMPLYLDIPLAVLPGLGIGFVIYLGGASILVALSCGAAIVALNLALSAALHLRRLHRQVAALYLLHRSARSPLIE